MIRVVYFDAVGTVIYPDPPVIDVYQDVARQHGCEMDSNEIQSRMRSEFQKQEAIDRHFGWYTSVQREYNRWHKIVTVTFAESTEKESIFEALYAWFARVEAWRIYPDVEATLKLLADIGKPFGLASNFDSRLRKLVEEMPLLHPFLDRLLISSELGLRKPNPKFFQKLMENAGAAPEDILYIGDEWDNDVAAPSLLGMQAYQIQRTSPSDRPNKQISDLLEIVELLRVKADVSSM